MSVRFGPSSDPGGDRMRLRWCVLATALVLVVTACGGGSSSGRARRRRRRPRRSRRRRPPRPTASARPRRSTATEIGVTADDDHRHRHRRREQPAPARPVPGFVGRHEGVGRLHQLQGRPRVPQGRGQGGRLEAEPDRRRERGHHRVRQLARDSSARPRCSCNDVSRR